MKTYTEHIFEELVDNSTEEKLRRYLERKRKERDERYRNMLHPKTREELQDMIIDAIEKNGPEVDLNYIDTSEIEDMNLLFYKYYINNRDKDKILRSFNGGISYWDVSNVKDMSYMFCAAKKFNQDISDWDVSSVTDMGFMFSCATNFNRNISDWDVSGVEDMRYMFKDATSFNSDISDWDVSSATDMRNMFSGAKNFNQNLSSWGVTGKDTTDMFNGCPIEDKNKPKGLKFRN